MRWVTNLVGLLVAAYLVRGVEYNTTAALALASLILAVVNVTIKPLLVVLTLPVEIITLGLFTLVINGFMLIIVSALVGGFSVSGIVPAIVGSIVISLVGGVLYHAVDKADHS